MVSEWHIDFLSLMANASHASLPRIEAYGWSGSTTTASRHVHWSVSSSLPGFVTSLCMQVPWVAVLWGCPQVSLRPMQLIYSSVVRGRLHHGHLCPSPAVLVGSSNPDSTSSVPMTLYMLCLENTWQVEWICSTLSKNRGRRWMCCHATPASDIDCPSGVNSIIRTVYPSKNAAYFLHRAWPRATNVCATSCAHESAT